MNIEAIKKLEANKIVKAVKNSMINVMAFGSSGEGIYSDTRALKLACIVALSGRETISKITKIEDHKDGVNITWKQMPSEFDKLCLKKSWDLLGECCIEHFLETIASTHI